MPGTVLGTPAGRTGSGARGRVGAAVGRGLGRVVGCTGGTTGADEVCVVVGAGVVGSAGGGVEGPAPATTNVRTPSPGSASSSRQPAPRVHVAVSDAGVPDTVAASMVTKL